MSTTSVLIIGEETRRLDIRRWLAAWRGIDLVGELGESDIYRLTAGLMPDVVVLDCGLASVNPLVALPWLASLARRPLVIALDSVDATPMMEQMLRDLGADARLTVAELERLGPTIDNLTNLTQLPRRQPTAPLLLAS